MLQSPTHFAGCDLCVQFDKDRRMKETLCINTNSDFKAKEPKKKKKQVNANDRTIA